jgi:protein tyrosine/serine phosphatase
VATVLVAVVVTFRNPWFYGNIGVVAPGLVYRSAQPSGDFPQVTARFHLASILNLRGGSLADTWYKAEVDTAQAQGIDFYDLPMSATRRPHRRELLILLDFFERCRYPLLIHCKSGSDRTGLAAALYLVSQKGESPERAEQAFSLQYGHIPLLGPQHLHEPFQEYAAWLKSHDLPHSPARFRAWVEQVYESKDAPRGGPVPHLKPGPRQPSP